MFNAIIGIIAGLLAIVVGGIVIVQATKAYKGTKLPNSSSLDR